MLPRPTLPNECLSLVAALYGAVADPGRFPIRRAECEAWVARHGRANAVAARFVRQQVARAVEASAGASAGHAGLPGACAVVTVDDRGRAVAAADEAWTLLGLRADDPLRLPFALRAFVRDAAVGLSVPRALRVPLDDGSTELAGIVLGVEKTGRAAGATLTLLLCDVGRDGAPAGHRGPGAEVRQFRRPA